MKMKHSPPGLVIVSILCGCLAFGSLRVNAVALPSASDLATSATSFVLRPGVVVDPARSTVYLMTPESSVKATHLGSGNELWVNTAGAQPLGLYGDLLIVLAEPLGAATVEVLFLDTRTGTREAVIPITLPEGVVANVDQQPKHRFSASALVSSGEIFLLWQFVGCELRGMPVYAGETAEEVDPCQQRRAGSVQLDLATLRASATIEAQAPQPPPPKTPDLQPGETLPNVTGRQFRAADERHVLASERTGDGGTWERYRWTILDRASGTRLGEIRQPFSMAPFFVTGSVLVYESQPCVRRLESGGLAAQGRQLTALDLASGREVWSVALRDTVYRGPLPP